MRLEAIVLPDKRQVSVKPAAILRCTMASALADWVRSDIAPLAASLGSTISDLDNFDSFECRGRNRIVGAKLSEHGRANALDVRAFKFADGSSISLTDRTVPRGDARERAAFGLHAVFDGAGSRLGLVPRGPHPSRPDGTAQQLPDLPVDVLDPLPQKAPLLPAGRPDEAPPREVAAKPDDAKSDAAKSDAAKAHGAEPEAQKSDAEKTEEAEPSREEKPAKKKRRQNRRFDLRPRYFRPAA